mmetsp:Transcript_4379/g.13993  ORF Transcript_4379/g.13993 Transcript_4379/m.13993 type:complete len:240 (-) Transcript_4379:37-756(-)
MPGVRNSLAVSGWLRCLDEPWFDQTLVGDCGSEESRRIRAAPAAWRLEDEVRPLLAQCAAASSGSSSSMSSSLTKRGGGGTAASPRGKMSSSSSSALSPLSVGASEAWTTAWRGFGREAAPAHGGMGFCDALLKAESGPDKDTPVGVSKLASADVLPSSSGTTTASSAACDGAAMATAGPEKEEVAVTELAVCVNGGRGGQREAMIFARANPEVAPLVHQTASRVRCGKGEDRMRRRPG